MRYFHDNFFEKEFGKTWEYILDRQTIDLAGIEKYVSRQMIDLAISQL